MRGCERSGTALTSEGDGDLRLSLACGPYDRVQPLIDGRVRPEGVDLEVRLGKNTRRRQQETVDGLHDAAEFYLGAYIADRAHRTLGVTAIPVFIKRMFRHSYVYVNRRGGIGSPEELAGKRIGIQSWFTTTAIWMKGVLADDYGVDLSSVMWVSEFSETYLGVTAPDWARIEPLGAGESLHALLVDGQVDAVITTRIWAPDGHGDITFLWPDYDRVEREYYMRTGSFPLMHVLVVRDDVLQRHPGVAMRLYDACQEAKRQTYEWLAWQRVHQSSMWFRHLWEEEQAVSGGDPYAWGFAATEHEVDRLLDLCWRQGVTQRRLRPSELFHPSTLAT